MNNDDVDNKLDTQKDERLFICPECKEYTSEDEPCCGIGPYCVDIDLDMER